VLIVNFQEGTNPFWREPLLRKLQTKRLLSRSFFTFPEPSTSKQQRMYTSKCATSADHSSHANDENVANGSSTGVRQASQGSKVSFKIPFLLHNLTALFDLLPSVFRARFVPPVP